MIVAYLNVTFNKFKTSRILWFCPPTLQSWWAKALLDLHVALHTKSHIHGKTHSRYYRKKLLGLLLDYPVICTENSCEIDRETLLN